MINKLLVLGLLILFAVPASAHEVKTTGSMSVLLHMEPQDSPIIRQPATLFFSFDDQDKKFNLADCECSASIEHMDKEVFSSGLTPEEAYGFNVGSLGFTFPHKGIFTVNLTGKSKTAQFSDIRLSYDVRIEREDANQAPIDPVIANQDNFYVFYWAGLTLLFACATIIIVLNRIKKRNK